MFPFGSWLASLYVGLCAEWLFCSSHHAKWLLDMQGHAVYVAKSHTESSMVQGYVPSLL